MIEIRIPASTGNLGSGFDVFGLAVRLYLKVRVGLRKDKKTVITFSGEGSNSISRKQNLVYSTIKTFLRSKNADAPGFTLDIRNSIPVKRGLGSSGTARLAGIIAADYLGKLELTKKEILSEAIRLEGPPDNINSSYVGGLTASLILENGITEYRKYPFPGDLTLVFAVPEFTLTTAAGRKVLPEKYPLKDTIYNLQRVSLFFEAVRGRDYELLSHLLQDRLHQDYRAGLIPGLKEILSLSPGDGLIGTCLSGSGPTACALADDNHEEIGNTMVSLFQSRGIAAGCLIVKADNRGTIIRRME
ncbi:homoserine kinase [candidate division KSB1 bacterium]